MVERQDLIPLARAAALAHDHLFPDDPVKETKALDVIALALSVLIPLYHRNPQDDTVRALSESDLAHARFTRGATTLEWRNRPPLGSIVVSREQLYAAIRGMREDSLILGRMSLVRRQQPAKHRQPSP